jgi:hypothetical protein
MMLNFNLVLQSSVADHGPGALTVRYGTRLGDLKEN